MIFSIQTSKSLKEKYLKVISIRCNQNGFSFLYLILAGEIFQIPSAGLWINITTRSPLTILKDELNKIGLSSQYLAKLRGSKLIVIENNLAKPGAELNHLKKFTIIGCQTTQAI